MDFRCKPYVSWTPGTNNVYHGYETLQMYIMDTKYKHRVSLILDTNIKYQD